MAEVKWIKIVTDIFDDEKIRLIESMPEGDALVCIWFKLLCLAGRCNEGGCIVMQNRLAYTDEMLAIVFRKDIAVVRMALELFVRFGMVEIINEAYVIANWEKHQNVEGMEKLREQWKTNSKKYRDKKKELSAPSYDGHMTSYENHNTDIDKEIDKEEDKEEKDNYIVQQVGRDRFQQHQLEAEFERLWKEYPRKEGKQKAFTAYQRARRDGTEFQEVYDGIIRYKRYIEDTVKSPEFIAMGQTWFNQARWQDEYKHETSHGGYESNEFFKMAMEAGLKGE